MALSLGTICQEREVPPSMIKATAHCTFEFQFRYLMEGGRLGSGGDFQGTWQVQFGELGNSPFRGEPHESPLVINTLISYS